MEINRQLVSEYSDSDLTPKIRYSDVFEEMLPLPWKNDYIKINHAQEAKVNLLSSVIETSSLCKYY
jgi:hypothetical protein